ncbi:MAG TPA: VOC family protein [Thermoplasmata archaeon]|nr:VOC family protein [Thermoplasmata archaeon]
MFDSAFVNLYTHDIEAGIRFYRDLLGFRETFRTPRDGVPTPVEMSLQGFGLGLGTVDAAKRVHGVDATRAVLRWSWSSGPTTSMRRSAC